VKPFVINKHGRLVFPATVLGELDFSVMHSLDQFTAVIGRDFESKAPTGTDIRKRVETGAYTDRFSLLRDLGQNLFWVNRYSMTMFDKRPTRWRDLPKRRPDVFLPVLTPWEDGEAKVAAVEGAWAELPTTWDAAAEQEIFDLLFDLYRHKRHHATELPAVKPTVAEFLERPGALTWVVPEHDPDYPVFSLNDILDADGPVAELEALRRWAMVLHNQYPWDRSRTQLRPVSEIGDDDWVIAFHPHNRDVVAFLDRVRSGSEPVPSTTEAIKAVPPVRPYPAVHVRDAFRVQARLESIAVARGEIICDNADVVRNASFSWSPMSAEEIHTKTGIAQRRYTAHDIAHLSLAAAKGALAHAKRTSEEIGAVLVATCTSDRLIPSLSTWLSGELGILQTHCSADIVAACAGFPYGLSDAVRLIQEIERPVLLVCVEKFSDKIGAVRTSRMIFGDGAAAIVVAPAPEGQAGDVHVMNTYASGPWTQVNSIIWPNPEFDNDITVYGPEVKALAGRYLIQMIEELGKEPGLNGGTLLDDVELIVPHQANKTMILQLAAKAGVKAEQLYFNIETMGNVSSASIPVAIADAVRDKVITGPTRVFAPGFGAGAVGGYAVLTVDPAIVAPEVLLSGPGPDGTSTAATTSQDIATAFGD
jgi:3-oxoacyl-(acyl-carrier-protein) synthase III